MKKVNKILLILSMMVVLSSCTELSTEKSILTGASFPSIVSKIEASEKPTGEGSSIYQNKGLYIITAKKADGDEFYFTSNVKFSIGDTLTLGIDTTGAFAKVLVNPGVKTEATDSVPTVDSTQTN